jgi:hypothetical protein
VYGRAGEPAGPPAPVVSSISPPGATVGATTNWVLRGRNLAGVDTDRISGEGVTVTFLRADDDRLELSARTDPQATPGFRDLRVEGPEGCSNLLRVRIDRLTQCAEREPNDDPKAATPLPNGAAGVGVLTPGDVDHFRVEARAGERRTVEVEARRLGTPVTPVVTVIRSDGRPLYQAREVPGVEGDCRFSWAFPADGPYVIQVRDNLYHGAEEAVYRLRVTDEPFATGLFPLGGPAARSVEFSASGGSLAKARTRTLTLTGDPGTTFEVGPFDGPGGPVTVPMLAVVGSGPERVEPAEAGEAEPLTPLDPGATVNGRLSKPGEVDRYRWNVKGGEPIRIEVVASALGSWLDPVVTVRDGRGEVLTENDDGPFLEAVAGLAPPGDPGGRSLDSRLDLTPRSDGTVTVEVADRYGEGGPEYAYRLSAGPPRPDFAVQARLPNGSAPAGGAEAGPGPSGVFNLRPGSEVTIPLRVAVNGRTGPITLRAVGLPAGVSAAPVTVRPAGAARVPTGGRPAAPPSFFVTLVLQVAPTAPPARGEIQIIGTATPADGPAIRRVAHAVVGLGGVTLPPPARPVTFRVTRFRVVGLRTDLR